MYSSLSNKFKTGEVFLSGLNYQNITKINIFIQFEIFYI